MSSFSRARPRTVLPLPDQSPPLYRLPREYVLPVSLAQWREMYFDITYDTPGPVRSSQEFHDFLDRFRPPPPPPTAPMSLDDHLAIPDPQVTAKVITYLLRPSVLAALNDIPMIRALHAAVAVPADCSTTCSHLSGTDFIPVLTAAWNSSQLGIDATYNSSTPSPPNSRVVFRDRVRSKQLIAYVWG